ncbi:MAG: SulP family inorganic anion transporter, partial [Bacteroidota bacterium]
DAPTIIGVLLDIPQSILNANPIITFLSLLSVILLVFHAKISYKLFHFVPAPVWVLVIAILFVYGFNFLQPHDVTLFGKAFPVGPSFLIDLPENILQAVIHPDFSRLGDLPFWLTVASITIIASIQNLAMAKAVDKLDPYKRKTNLDKDLIGVGIGTAICGLIGGLPIITVIVRSSVNIHNNAKTSWSNFYHGIFLLLFIILLSPIIQKIPLAALAAILVFTGYKLASPRVIKQTYSQGIEQLLFFSVTLAITLATNLLWGILSGMAITLAVHLLLARMPVELFLKKIFKSNTRLIKQKDLSYELQVDGIANFLSMPKLKDLLNAVPEGANLRIDLSETHLVDLTVLEFFQEYGGKLKSNGGKFDLKGLQHHVASTNHPLALKSLNVPLKSKKSPRQISLEAFSKETGGDYMLEVDLDTSYLRNFQFFESRPIERKTNVIKGNFSNPTIQWEMADITFDEGALQASEVYHTTVQVIHLPFEIPRFILEKEGFFDKIFDRVLALSGQKDIDFQLFTKFSNRFLLKGEDEAIIRAFFTEELILFFENTDVYHVESNGEALLIFQYLRLARTEEASKMLMFSEDLIHLLATQIER